MNEPAPAPARRRLRLITLAVVTVCALALAAGAFALSYPGARATAVSAGVSANLARVYPGIFDAVLLVAGAAALSLRGAWRVFAWLVMLVVVGAVAAADTSHAMSVALPKRPMEATVAAVPWAVLVVGLILLDAMVRHAGPRRNPVPPGRGAGPRQAVAAGRQGNGAGSSHGTGTVPLSALLAVQPGRSPAAAAPAVKPAAPVAVRPVSQPAVKPGRPASLPPTGSTVPAARPGGEPAAAAPPELPEPTPPQAGGRDEPSHADAEPSGPGAFFSRLRRSFSVPGKPPKARKPASAEQASTEAASTEPPAAEPAAAEPPAAKPADTKPADSEPADSEKPAAQSPKAESGS